MSFMNSGSECSTSQNPMAQFVKHSAEDRTLQHERFGPSGAASPASMRASGQQMNVTDRQMMNKFMNGEAQQHHDNSFAFDQMRLELNGVQNTQRSSASKSWVNDFSGQTQHLSRATPDAMIRHSPSPALGVADHKWGAEFNTQQPLPNMHAMTGYIPQMSRMYTPSMMTGASTAATAQQPQIVELDNKHWEEQFRQMEESANATSKGKEVSSAKEANQDTKINEAREAEASDKQSDFETVWENIRTQVFDNVDDWNAAEHENWDNDFHQYTKSRPDFGQYWFEENNQYMNELDPFSIGVRIVETGGNLSEAALAFEAALQKDPNHVEAWSRLGSVQAQSEKEESAIRALERCIDLDPGNLTALMDLAVSYTNESYENAAYSTLEKWIATKYPDIVEQARRQDPRTGIDDLHSRVTELFIKAAQLSPDGANMDASVQNGLGVLFYGNNEFDKAIDCFNAALAVRPTDPILWNRLGATLANSERSEDAIEAYSKALELRPSFVRARYNIGVSCVNIGCYHEAAQHLLTALSMNNIEGAPGDDVLANNNSNLLSTLKRVFLAMNRRDLSEKVGNGMDINSFRSEFDF